MNTKRIVYLDIAKAIGIFLVVLGHVVTSDTEMKRIIYSFHMPLFFLLSGILIKPRVSWNFSTWKEFISKKAFALLLPYLSWGLIYSKFSFKNLVYILYGTRETLIRADCLTSLWFLPVMFVAFIIVQFVLLCFQRAKCSNLFLTLAALALVAVGYFVPHVPRFGWPFGFDVALVASSFMLVGYVAKSILNKIQESDFWVIILYLALFCAIFFFTVKMSTSQVGYVLMANAIYGKLPIFYVNALIGSAIVILLSMLLSKPIKIAMPLTVVGEATLGIFLVHKPFVELAQKLCDRFIYVHSFNLPLLAIGIAVICLIISLVAVKIITKVAPFMIGKRYEKN